MKILNWFLNVELDCKIPRREIYTKYLIGILLYNEGHVISKHRNYSRNVRRIYLWSRIHSTCIFSKDNILIATCMLNQGEHKDALKYCNKHLKYVKSSLGNEHKLTSLLESIIYECKQFFRNKTKERNYI